MKQRFIRALAGALPPADRATVLGDLEERGFRLRDLVSVLPGAWISHLHREWIAPVPNLSGAKDAALLRRTEQLRPFIRFPWLLGPLAISVAIVHRLRPEWDGLLAILPGLLLSPAAYLLLRHRRPQAPLSGSPLEQYRAALKLRSERMSTAFLVAIVGSALIPGIRPSIRVVGVLLGLYRGFRSGREINNASSQTPIKE